MEVSQPNASSSNTQSQSQSQSQLLKRKSKPLGSVKNSPSDTRKRRRGALQDISNTGLSGTTSTKPTSRLTAKATSTSSSSSRLRKPTASSTAKADHPSAPIKKTSSAHYKSTSGIVKRGRSAASSTAPATATDHEDLHAPSHKKQTSLLEFQLSSSTASSEGDHLHQRSTRSRAQPSVSLRGPSEATVSSQQHKVQGREAQTQTELSDCYRPRVPRFTFDWTGSGFDEKTYREEIRDIDVPLRKKSQYCTKLAKEMDAYRRKHETKYVATPTYIGSVQTDINEKMRTILIDWLVEVGQEYELQSCTLHRAVNLVDRFLLKTKIHRKQFQLLGCACMLLAAKFEEVYGPSLDDFVYISDGTYTSEQMLEMESKVLQTLEYRISSTTCSHFLPRYIEAGCDTDVQRSLVTYLCEFAMLFYHLLKYFPSQLVASAVYLARFMTKAPRGGWTPTLHHFTRYSALELKECVLELAALHRQENEIVQSQPDTAKAVSDKFLTDNFHKASAVPYADPIALEKSFAPYQISSQPSQASTQTLQR